MAELLLDPVTRVVGFEELPELAVEAPDAVGEAAEVVEAVTVVAPTEAPDDAPVAVEAALPEAVPEEAGAAVLDEMMENWLE